MTIPGPCYRFVIYPAGRALCHVQVAPWAGYLVPVGKTAGGPGQAGPQPPRPPSPI